MSSEFWEGRHGKPPQPSPYSLLKGVAPVTREHKGFELFAVQQARTGTWYAKALGYDDDFIGAGPDAEEALARAAMYLDADIPPREKMNPPGGHATPMEYALLSLMRMEGAARRGDPYYEEQVLRGGYQSQEERLAGHADYKDFKKRRWLRLGRGGAIRATPAGLKALKERLDEKWHADWLSSYQPARSAAARLLASGTGGKRARGAAARRLAKKNPDARAILRRAMRGT